MSEAKKCEAPVETFSRVSGYFQPIQQWNKGKREEQKERVTYNIHRAVNEKLGNVDDR